MKKRATTHWFKIICYYGIAVVFTSVVALLITRAVIPEYFHYVAMWGPALGAFSVLLVSRSLSRAATALFTIRRPLWIVIGGLSPLWASALLIVFLYSIGYPLPALSDIGKVNFLGDIAWWVVPLWLLSVSGEELGWRGFLYPELRKRYSILTTTFIMWPLWLLWHLPFFLYLPTYTHMSAGMIAGFAGSLLSGTVVLNWIFEKSERNILSSILWHSSFNVLTASAFGSGNIAVFLSILVILFSCGIIARWVYSRMKQ